MFSRHYCAVLLFACGLAAADDFWVESRDELIPTVIEFPDVAEGTPVPLVVLAHGHGGSKDENGGFAELASMLAENGIASVRMDFPGCGDSAEEFAQNNITNMLYDIDASLRFTLDKFDIDRDRIGILGYSMGGRLAMLAADPLYSAMVLWAPVADNGPQVMFRFLGGRDNYYKLRSQAVRDGSVLFETPWNTEQRLGKEWFYDMERTAPLYSIRRYEGPLLILHGTDDRLISPDNATAARDAAVASKAVTLDLVEGATHGFGFYSEDPEVRAHVLGTSVAFLRERLKEAD